MSTDLPFLPVDFGNCDDDGSVRLVTRGVQNAIEEQGLVLSDGMRVLVSDGELAALAHANFRDSMWVAVIDEWLEVEGPNSHPGRE